MKKVVIANWGGEKQGKSDSVKRVFYLLKDKYASQVFCDRGDIKAIVEIKGHKVGIESQGDPGSRLFGSIDDFMAEGCVIIVCACRSWGKTAAKVASLKEEGYEVIWTQNDRTNTEELHPFLNQLYAEKVVKFIEASIINGN